jgi:uncharacterized membrane protein
MNPVENLPVRPAPGNDDIPRKVAAGEGLRWVLAGLAFYKQKPLLLSAAFAVTFGIVMLLGLIPGIGASLSEFATPMMIAGFMAGYRVLDEGRELEMPTFFDGVKRVPLPLMTLGAIQLIATVLIGQLMLAMGFDPQAVMEAAKNTKTSPAEMQAIANASLPAVLAGLSLFVPVMMATWFAPALVLFGNARPVTALGVSLKAGLRNWQALFVNGLVLGLLLFVSALVPLMLGLLVAMPILFGSMYASYQAIFAVWAGEPDATPGV